MTNRAIRAALLELAGIVLIAVGLALGAGLWAGGLALGAGLIVLGIALERGPVRRTPADPQSGLARARLLSRINSGDAPKE